MKIISPASAAKIEIISTAPAETSLASLACGCSAVVKESTTVSMAVFVSSTEITRPINIRIKIQSSWEMFKMRPKSITTKVIKKWNLRLGSSRKAADIPEKAYLKDNTRRR